MLLKNLLHAVATSLVCLSIDDQLKKISKKFHLLLNWTTQLDKEDYFKLLQRISFSLIVSNVLQQ